jgi:anthranilate synthase/aminodeoxychorismate synthase-like glutamine amidotransferase
VILLIDNYDSFTFNLYQLLGTHVGHPDQLRVVRNDALLPDELAALQPDHVVLSPGPGHPSQSGLSLQASDLFPQTPLLGVCLGHQALGLTHGAKIVSAPRPTHGRPIAIEHHDRILFGGMESPVEAALYHSLAVSAEDLPPSLTVTARSEHGDVMALRHRDRPHFGVQFHPESFMTTAGPSLVDNFLRLT